MADTGPAKRGLPPGFDQPSHFGPWAKPLEAQARRGRNQPQSWWLSALRWLAELLVYLVIATLVVTLVRLFLVQPFLVPSGSMEQTLQEGDTIVTWKPGEAQRGDIIVFRDDLGWLGPLAEEPPAWKKVLAWMKVLAPQDEQYLVKRLIGLPGDHVTCCDAQGRVSVNGQPLDESPYLSYQSPESAQISFDLVVPENRVFVMGDHRDGSADSRYHMCRGTTATPELTFPSLDAIQGKVIAIMLPLSRTTTFDTPATFATVPTPTESPPADGQTQWTCPQ